MKKVISIIIFILLLLSMFVSASNLVTTIPDSVESFDEWKAMILTANSETGYFSTSTSDYFGVCELSCFVYPLTGDCDPCKPGEVPSMCTWHPDSMSSLNYFTSSYSYCNSPTKPYNYFNMQCYCKVPSVECSGGREQGDRKCSSGDVYECNNQGTWEFVTECNYGCDSGSCQEETCESHSEKQCYIGDVYWYDSCGQVEEKYENCESDEVCSNSQCIKVCEEKYIGSKKCSSGDVSQQFQSEDCSTEYRIIEECDNGCSNGECTEEECNSCGNPSSWSSCLDGLMSRTNYKCSSTTSYECESFTEEVYCDCSLNSQCDYDEYCLDHVCTELQCEDDQIADNNECINGASNYSEITIGVILFSAIVLILVIIFIVTRSKRGRR